MPQPYAADLSSMAQAAQTKAQHGVAAAKQGKADPAICPTDDENKVMPKTRTFSWDYAWRSGVAGGVAGCAVSRISLASSRERQVSLCYAPRLWYKPLIESLFD